MASKDPMAGCDILTTTVSKRSPVLGYNHNFKHRGLIFHVQTEDSGVDNPHLFTHLFHGGVIISSRKVDYDAASAEDIVKSLMQSQHKAVLKDLKIGTFDDKIDSYLGNKEDLLPRKADSVCPAPPTEVATTEPATDALAATEPSVSTPAPPPDDAGQRDTEPSLATPPPPATPELAHSGAISLDTPRASIRQPIVDSSATNPAPRPAEIPLDLDSPPAATGKQFNTREPIPTPISIPVASENYLGDPVVTFNQGPDPAAPIAAIPHDSVGERSATYSIQRPSKRRRAETQSRNVGSGPSRAPAPPEVGLQGRPTGKAANPQPGKRRSSVVVSRPAVIIGAPARAVGKRGDANRSRRRTPAARKARNKDLFGNDTISEKSLDEVIMAYLSEDGGDE